MDRQDIFVAINDEREYQERKWKDVDKINTTGDYLCYIERYLNNAKFLNNPAKPDETMINVAKIITLGVAMAEKYGIPEDLHPLPVDFEFSFTSKVDNDNSIPENSTFTLLPLIDTSKAITIEPDSINDPEVSSGDVKSASLDTTSLQTTPAA